MTYASQQMIINDVILKNRSYRKTFAFSYIYLILIII